MAEDPERPAVLLVVACPGTSIDSVRHLLGPAAAEVRDVGRLGHDLATPLAIISGMADTLATAWDRLGETDRARLLASITTQAARATAIVQTALQPEPMTPDGGQPATKPPIGSVG